MNMTLNNGSVIKSDNCEYVIKYCLGRGASAVAYMAECRKNSDFVSNCILKEYNPLNCDEDNFQNGMLRFIDSGYKQNEIRQKLNMCNQTPPVSNIFKANNTAYIEVICYDGSTLDKLTELSLSEYTEILLAVSRNISAYHNSGCLCLDLKPENIFVLLGSNRKVITQLVEFIDFDSVRTADKTDKYLCYTREWAPPEQTDSFSKGKICEASDIYTIGELAFWIYFGRHSENSEHRGFSKYNFEKCKPDYRVVFSRPSVQKLLTDLFRHTLRPSVNNRFSSVNDVISIFEELVKEVNQKDFVIPILPHISPLFVGRENEISCISENLKTNNSLWLYGIGGIGKTTVVRNFINQKKSDYDIIIYLEFEGNIIKTFTDDKQLKISTLRKNEGESDEEYFSRKLEMLELICANKSVLFIIDNFEGLITKEMSMLTKYSWHIIISSRRKPPENSFYSICINAISDLDEIYKLISLNIGRSLTKTEKICFDEIIKLTERHTLVLELIARQIAAGSFDVQTALEIIRETGFSHFSEEKVSSYKDNEEIYGTLAAIISVLFSNSNLNDSYITYMKVLSLIDFRGLERSLINNILKLTDNSILSTLVAEGWIYEDKVIRVHPVIAETVRNWSWPDSERDIQVMKYHKNVIAVYEGMNDFEYILKITEEAKKYTDLHQRDILIAMYFDMTASFYDSLLGGAYQSENEDELKLIQEMINSEYYAIEYAANFENAEEAELLCSFMLSLASICIRTNADNDLARTCIEKASTLILPDFDNYKDSLCSYSMVSAWYYTVTEPDINKFHECIETASNIAYEIYPTALEIIDIIHIPAADCYFTWNEYEAALSELSKAVDICRSQSNILQYTDKLAELLCCMLDIYFTKGEYKKCAELINEIDEINEKYSSQGIYRDVNPFIAETIFGDK